MAIAQPSAISADARKVSEQPWRFLLALMAANLSLVALIVVLDRQFGIDYWNIVRDPNAIANQPAYFGFYSNMGSLLWIVAGTPALFAAGCLRLAGVRNQHTRLLLIGGLFCALAGLDDFFMFHEQSYRIGIPEKAVMAGYALFLMAVAAAAYPIFRATNWVYLGAALVFLGASAVVDMADLTLAGAVLIEESLKFLGIVFLAAYFITLSVTTVSARLGSTNSLRDAASAAAARAEIDAYEVAEMVRTARVLKDEAARKAERDRCYANRKARQASGISNSMSS